MTTGRIHRVNSADGTQITAQVHGDGRPLVLVPGGPADGDTGWLTLLPELTDRFTCYPINTRGRGLSADHPDHARQRVVEDVVALVESIGEPVYLFGHSAGATHALEAAASTRAVRHLALYEPTMVELGDDALRASFAEALSVVEEANAAGRPEVGAQVFIERLALANPDELAACAAADAAVHMAPLVPVVLDEAAASGPPQLTDLGLLDRVTTPVLLLHGDRTAPFYLEVVRELTGRLEEVEVRELPGLGHLGPEVHPEAVAQELEQLLDRAAAVTGS